MQNNLVATENALHMSALLLAAPCQVLVVQDQSALLTSSRVATDSLEAGGEVAVVRRDLVGEQPVD